MPITTTNARPSRAPRKTHPMTPRLGVVLLPLFVAGCGLPPAVTIASFAIDAISLAVSEKTVADHALSQIAQKDCAMWRGFTGDELCIDEDSAFAVAAADGQPTAGGADSADLVSFTTASGPTGDELMNLAMLDAESDLLEPAEPQSADFTTASAPAEEGAIYAPAAPVSHFHVPPVRAKKAKSSRKAEAPKKPPVTISAVSAPVANPAPAADDDAAAEADGSEQEEAPRARVPEEPATSALSSVSVNFLLFGA